MLSEKSSPLMVLKEITFSVKAASLSAKKSENFFEPVSQPSKHSCLVPVKDCESHTPGDTPLIRLNQIASASHTWQIVFFNEGKLLVTSFSKSMSSLFLITSANFPFAQRLYCKCFCTV